MTVFPVLVLNVLVAAVALVFAVANIVDDAANADVLDLAAALERGVDPGAGYAAAFVARRGALFDRADCRDGVSRARLTVALAAGVGLRSAQARLMCAPTDGNAWLQWARVLREAPDRTREGVRRSERYAPAERWVLAPRLDVEAELASPELDPEFERDLARFIRFEPVSAVAAAYVNHDEPVRARMQRIFAQVEPARRKALAAEIRPRGAAAGGLPNTDDMGTR